MITNYKDWNKETTRMVQFTENAPAELRGKKLPILKGEWPDFAIRFNDKVDLSTLDVISSDDPTYDDCAFPTLNDLVAQVMIVEWFPYQLVDLNSAEYWRKDNGRLDVPGIVKYFKDRGLNVSTKAIRHNYKAWRAGYKSGYRDEANGTHVFSPCGGNPFNIHVSSLHPDCTDWQKTYTC